MIASFPLVPWVLISKLPIPFDRKLPHPNHSGGIIHQTKSSPESAITDFTVVTSIILIFRCPLKTFLLFSSTAEPFEFIEGFPIYLALVAFTFFFFLLITFQFFNLFLLLLLVATIILIAVRKCQNIDTRRSQMYMSKFEYMLRTVPFSACN